MNLAGKNVLIIGCGKSGIGAAVFLKKQGANPILFDAGETIKEEDIREKLPADFEAEICLRELTEEIKNDNLIIDLALNLKGTEKQATDKY